MSLYNLYLLDETRDPLVIARLARVTGLAETLVRRELRRPPFLVLREHGLSQAVAVRRDFEQMGLTLRLELVENPTGDRRHPLASAQALADGGEIVLEEGAGFTDTGEAPPSGHDPQNRATGRRLAMAAAALLLLALGVLALGRWLAGGGDPERRRLDVRLDQALPDLRRDLETALAGTLSAGAADSLVRRVDELERELRPRWEHLPRGRREEVEDLLARRQTLVMRRVQAAGAGAAVAAWTPDELREAAAADGETFWERLAVQWGRREAPAGLGEQLALERLDDELTRIARGRNAAARARLAALERRDPDARARLGALRLAGSLRQKGLVWTGEEGARQGWVDLPDSTVLEVEEAGGAVHHARVEQGRLVFTEPVGELTSISVRLAALDRQPAGLRRILETGLSLLDPAAFLGTLPGSRLPRLDPARAAAQWERGGDPALKEELARLGLRGGDLRHPVLERDPGGQGQADLRGWLRAAAACYQRARVWPQVLELRTPAGRYRVSGCELWHLTRE